MKIETIHKDAVLLSVKRALKDLPVASDVPRLVSKIKIVKNTGKESSRQPIVSVSTSKTTRYNNQYEPDMSELSIIETESDEVLKQRYQLYRLFHDLAKRIQPDVLDYISIDALSQVDLDSHEAINEYLEQFGEDKPLVRVLKSLHQSIVSNVLNKLRVAVNETDIRLKDVRGQWEILIKQGEPFSTCHRRKEQVFLKKETGMEMQFQMEWEYELFYDTVTFDVTSSALYLLDMTRENNTVVIPEKCEPGSVEETAKIIRDCFLGLESPVVAKIPKLSPREKHARFESISLADSAPSKKRTFSFASSEEEL
jgi:hypothetical protein